MRSMAMSLVKSSAPNATATTRGEAGADLVGVHNGHCGLDPGDEHNRADVHSRAALQPLDYAGHLRDVRRRLDLANGNAVDIGANHRREVVGEQAGIERVNPRYDQRARLSHPAAETTP